MADLGSVNDDRVHHNYEISNMYLFIFAHVLMRCEGAGDQIYMHKAIDLREGRKIEERERVE